MLKVPIVDFPWLYICYDIILTWELLVAFFSSIFLTSRLSILVPFESRKSHLVAETLQAVLAFRKLLPL